MLMNEWLELRSSLARIRGNHSPPKVAYRNTFREKLLLSFIYAFWPIGQPSLPHNMDCAALSPILLKADRRVIEG
jgi:hypothetical protein